MYSYLRAREAKRLGMSKEYEKQISRYSPELLINERLNVIDMINRYTITRQTDYVNRCVARLECIKKIWKVISKDMGSIEEITQKWLKDQES